MLQSGGELLVTLGGVEEATPSRVACEIERMTKESDRTSVLAANSHRVFHESMEPRMVKAANIVRFWVGTRLGA